MLPVSNSTPLPSQHSAPFSDLAPAQAFGQMHVSVSWAGRDGLIAFLQGVCDRCVLHLCLTTSWLFVPCCAQMLLQGLRSIGWWAAPTPRPSLSATSLPHASKGAALSALRFATAQCPPFESTLKSLRFCFYRVSPRLHCQICSGWRVNLFA
eukprot:5315719-Pleurochrysis_carterae.AAC.1